MAGIIAPGVVGIVEPAVAGIAVPARLALRYLLWLACSSGPSRRVSPGTAVYWAGSLYSALLKL